VGKELWFLRNKGELLNVFESEADAEDRLDMLRMENFSGDDEFELYPVTISELHDYPPEKELAEEKDMYPE